VPEGLTNALSQLPPPQQWPAQVVSYFVVDPLLALFRFVLDVAISPRTHRIVLRLSVLTSLVWVALGLAIAAYVGFYRAWVPDIGLSRSVWLQYGYDRPPYAEIGLYGVDKRIGVFAQDQEYDVSLDLIVPLSAANLDLGNFMVTLELTSAHNTTIHFASRPCIIVHEPGPIRAMNNLIYQLTQNAPAFILPSSSPPVQLITIPLLRRAILEPAQAAHPFASTVPAGVVQATVSVGRHDSNKYWVYGGGHGVGGVMHESGMVKAAASYEGFRSRGELQTHSANLRFDAHLTGLRYFMYHQPLASFVLFTGLFMAFELLSALTLWAIAAFYTAGMTQPHLGVEDNYMGRDTSVSGMSSPSSGNRDEYDSGVATGESDLDEVEVARRQARASLQARDAQELYEQRRAEQLRDEMEGRRMTAVDQPELLDDLELTQGRRILGRLDEETEEDTDVHASETSAGWEDVGEEGDEEAERPDVNTPIAESSQSAAGLRRRQTVKDEEGDDDDRFARQSTIGGSSTSRGASTIRSFGATSLGPSISSRAQTEAPSEIKDEDDTPIALEEIAEEEGDDTERELGA
jgi:hypothetical protein